MTRQRLLAAACALALVAAACNPTASASPPAASGGPASPAPTASPQATLTSLGSPPPCPAIPASLIVRPWWQTAVFYEVFVRSFADSNGDGIGDFDGLREHLDDIQRLGANALWLMPVAKSPSYHGYDVTDYTAVEPDYGSLDSFKRLLAAAHAKNIKVVIDFEANHTSVDHPWFQDALDGGKHHDWYIWSDTDPGWPNPIGAGDPWRPSKAGYYYALFWEGMPDLNLRNPAVTKELEKAAAFWQGLGVAGFRIDAARHLIEDGPDQQVNTPETHAWLQGFTNNLHVTTAGIGSGPLVVGEVADAERVSGGYVTDGSLDMAFDFEIGPAIMNAVSHGDAGSLLTSEGSIAKAYPNGGAGTFLTNHDQPRVMTQLHGDATAARLSAETLLTAPGTPFVYYGEELGMTGPKPDEEIRTPYPWTAAGPGYGFTNGTPWEPFGDGAATANAATEAADPGSLLSTYTSLIQLRMRQPTLATAAFVALDTATPKIAASLRVDRPGTPALLVIQNLGADDATNVAFTLRGAGPLCETPSATVAYPASMAGTAVAAPAVTSTGGLDGYVPLPTIPASSTVVLALDSGSAAVP